VVGHIVQDETLKLVRQNIFWPEMGNFIEDYVCSHPECQSNKELAMDSYNHSNGHTAYGIQFPWTALSNYRNQTDVDWYG
jgi:hypothetical protein